MADKKVNILINAKDNASKTFAKVAGAIGGLFAAGRIVGWTRDLINLGDGIGKASQRVGVSAEEWQKLQYAAERSGAGAANVETAFKTMGKTIFDASTGSKTAAQSLAFLGLSADKLRGMAPEKQFGEIAKRLTLVKDHTEQAVIAQKLFGESGAQLLPMIGTYEEMGQHLGNIGGVLKNDVAEAAGNFNTQIMDLTKTIQAMVANSGLITWLNDVTSSVNELGGATKAMKSIMETAVTDMELPLPDFLRDIGVPESVIKSPAAITSLLTGGIFNKAQVRVKPTGEMARTVGETYQEAPTAGEIAQKAEEVATGRNRAAEVAAAAAARATMEAAEEKIVKPIVDDISTKTQSTGPTGPLEGNVMRFLSGFGNPSVKASLDTATNTQQTAAACKDIVAEMKKLNEKALGYDIEAAPGI